jgi:hypothetical protein
LLPIHRWVERVGATGSSRIRANAIHVFHSALVLCTLAVRIRRLGGPRADHRANNSNERSEMSAYHEPEGELSPSDRDLHRALTSLKEEIEAVDWYHQRVVTCNDASLKSVLAHNRDEEIEHACMAIEWLRRTVPKWDENLRTYLFSEGEITGVEVAATSETGHADQTVRPRSHDGSLNVGSLKQSEA